HYSLLSLVSIFCCYLIFVFFFFFFFQAEDGIRDFHVTGVQTCALPISNTDTSRCQRMPSSRVMVGQTVTWSRPSSPTRPAAAHAFFLACHSLRAVCSTVSGVTSRSARGGGRAAGACDPCIFVTCAILRWYARQQSPSPG